MFPSVFILYLVAMRKLISFVLGVIVWVIGTGIFWFNYIISQLPEKFEQVINSVTIDTTQFSGDNLTQEQVVNMLQWQWEAFKNKMRTELKGFLSKKLDGILWQ